MNGAAHIMLIDDNPAWLESLSEYLRGKGFCVLTARNAGEALALMSDNEISLVVCDYRMPGLNGLELVRHLRRVRQNLAVLMVTSEEEPSLKERALAEGARAFLAKTASPRILLRKVRQFVAECESAVQATPKPWQRLLPRPQQPVHRLVRRPAGFC